MTGIVDPGVRSLVGHWMGGEKSTGVPFGRQHDAYDAFTILDTLVGTTGVLYTALNLATELTSAFHCEATVNMETKASCGAHVHRR